MNWVYYQDMTTTSVPETITTTDQNTLRPITWNVDFVQEEEGTLESSENGWTHFLGVSRPKGRKSYGMFVRMNADGQVLRHSNPKVMF